MFSPPATRKSHYSAQKDRNQAHDSPVTPTYSDNQRLSSVPNRPTTGTPAPWVPPYSVLSRVPQGKTPEKGGDADPIQPVHVGEFPEEVRNAQASFLQKTVPSETRISGGIDKETSLSWIVYDYQLFIWRYSSSATSKHCVVLEIPQFDSDKRDVRTHSVNVNAWMVCMVNWNSTHGTKRKFEKQSNSVGIVICNKKSQAIIYWPNIYSIDGKAPVFNLELCNGSEGDSSPPDKMTTPISQRQRSRLGSSYLVEKGCFNSLIVSAVPGTRQDCVALAAGSDGELWQFQCSPGGINRKRISLGINIGSISSSDSGQTLEGKGYPRSLVWRFQLFASEESDRQFLFLTDHAIQCFSVNFDSNLSVTKLWSYGLVGTDNDSAMKKDLAGQKRIWPLDMQIDDRGKELTILVATFCKDRVSSSSYTQYSLLTLQYCDNNESKEKVLGIKAPMQVIIPKARVEDENFLFSMKLRVGGKPSGSAIILSGDGTATVSNYWRNGTRLYQFDLPWDAGKVLDASVFPSTEDGDEGAWVVLTERAGVWAIPEKAVLLGGVEPPERSLSRKGSSNEGAAAEEKRSLAFGGNIAPRRASSEAWDAGDRQRAVLNGTAHPTAQDEESEALLGHLFQNFVLSGQVDNSLEKLKTSGAFDKDGETNVFTRMSKSIVDTLAKHWTTTRGAEIVAMSVVSSQLSDKQQKHQKFLQFLALSKCHVELSSKQRHSLQNIMEHGEKLAGIIQLRELQSSLIQNRSDGTDRMAGSLWDLIQLVGERARRNTVLLMDRDNTEVFYSKVSELEEVFYCLAHQLPYIIGEEQSTLVQIKRVCELSKACSVLIRAAMHYRSEHDTWYPLPDGLMSWCCKSAVRNGLWSVASFMLQLLKESGDWKEKSDLYSHLEQLTDVLLESYSSSNTAQVEHNSLLDEYCQRRDALLGSLYQHVKDFMDGKYKHPAEGMQDSKGEDLRKSSSSLLSIARRHEAYQTLWNICRDLNDLSLLRNLMHKSVGPKGGFSYYVFEQLYADRQFAKLLRLGEEFQEELTVFLRQHKDLLWLHEVFLNQFSSASETLHALAFSQEGAPMEDEDPIPRWGLSLADRKRLLNLSKIAAMAGRDDDFITVTKRIDADLKILKLQEEIISLISGYNDEQDTSLLPPEELIQVCLNANTRDLLLRAFDIFAWTSPSFRQSNRGLLEECWRTASNQDDWTSLYDNASIAQGWSDEQALERLSETVLFQASERCYGPGAESFEGGFDEVLPLRVEDGEGGSSVEGVLMQHKSFPDVGKLMVMAIMLGKVGGECEGESFMAMES